MATYYNHAQIGIVDSSGNVNVIYPKTEGSDVSVTPNSNYAAGDTVQKVISNLGSAAFKNASEFASATHNHNGYPAYVPSIEITGEKIGTGQLIPYIDFHVGTGDDFTSRIASSTPGVLDISGDINVGKVNGYSLNDMCSKKSADYIVNGENSIAYMVARDVSPNKYVEVGMLGSAYGLTAWHSDTKLKDNIKHTDETNALGKINNIDMIQFDWKNNTGHVDLGVSANQLETIIPDAVYEVSQEKCENEFDTLKNVNGNVLDTYLIKAVQELTDIVNEQKKEIEILKKEIEILKEKIK